MTEPRYVHGHHSSVLVSHQWRNVSNSAQHLVPYLRSNSHILDVGCGPGSLTADLARHCPDGHVLGIDWSQEVVALASATYQGDVVNCAFQQGDGGDMEFDDDSFDISHAHQVLQHIANPVGVLVEMARVTKRTGVVAVREMDFSSVHWYPASEQLDRWLATYRTMSRSFHGEPDAGRFLTSWVEQAGLEVEVDELSSWVFESPDDIQWWTEMWADRVLESNYADDAIQLGLLDKSELEEMSKGWIEWSHQTGARFVAPSRAIVARQCEESS